MSHIYSWNFQSKGAKELARALDWWRIYHDSDTFRYRPTKFVVNWGATAAPPEVLRCRLANRPDRVAIAADKLKTYQCIAAHEEDAAFLPWYTADQQMAATWLMGGDKRVLVERHVLNGHGGQGIRIVEQGEDVRAAPLYVEYVPKKEEYRVHVLGDKVYVQQKKRREDAPDDQVDWRIRNHGNGFIYATHDVAAPEPVIRAARDAVVHLGLHFGAVDIGWTHKSSRATVYEVNTAPGLEGNTLRQYVDFFTMLRRAK